MILLNSIRIYYTVNSCLVRLYSLIISCSLGIQFNELLSNNGKFKLKMEDHDEIIRGHLVLYHVLDSKNDENNVQLWQSDFARNGSAAILTV